MSVYVCEKWWGNVMAFVKWDCLVPGRESRKKLSFCSEGVGIVFGVRLYLLSFILIFCTFSLLCHIFSDLLYHRVKRQ